MDHFNTSTSTSRSGARLFAASERGAKYLAVRIGTEVHRLDQYADKLYCPDLMMARLTAVDEAAAEPEVALEELVATGLPPRVEWLGPSDRVQKKRDVTVRARIHVEDGGLGRLEWRLNGTVIGTLEKGRGLRVQREGIAVEKLLTLAPGANRVELVAYTERGDVASMPAGADYMLVDAVSEAPNLYVLAVGINQYRDVSLRLKYAVPDAQALVQSLRAAAGKVFGNVTAITLTDDQATRDRMRAAFAAAAAALRSNDVFVLYVAGHGITLDARYHFVPVDFRYRNDWSSPGARARRPKVR